ncbi:hypothetical protein DPMN_180996 [Dreissena polymorpha]|uniref:Uncharacterized protein n=2 Tax=Dreissena polymorpha TaxID=45954 RepID=A0A9D4DEE2_DREPO|nr:hypothetical protein DPMN_180996 [Dreissena polymorpha]
MLAAKAIVRTFEDMLKKLEKDHSRQIDMQALQNRVQEFEESLKTVTEINNNKQLVENIVNQHSELVTSWMSVWFTEREQSMQSKLRSQAIEMIAMGVQLTKYKFLASIEFEQLEKDLLEMIQSLPAKLKEGVVVEQFIEINETVLAILRKISRGLRHKEKLKVLKKYVWEDHDPLKADMDRDQSYFLAGIIYKEIQTSRKLIPVDQFISDLLLDVGRDDLRRMYCRLMKTSFSVRPQTPTNSPPVTSTENPQMWAVVTKMAGEMSEIHQRMTSIVGNFNTGEEIPLFGSKHFQTRESSSDQLAVWFEILPGKGSFYGSRADPEAIQFF